MSERRWAVILPNGKVGEFKDTEADAAMAARYANDYAYKAQSQGDKRYEYAQVEICILTDIQK